MKYKQCSLERSLGTVLFHQVSWIPSGWAKVGTILKLKEKGVWEDGWEVIGVGAEMDEKDLPDTHRARKVHRERTGDSLPKRLTNE